MFREAPEVGEQIRNALPHAQQAAEDGPPRADEKRPFSNVAALAQGNFKLPGDGDDQPGAAAGQRSQPAADDDHGHAEDGRHGVARRQVEAASLQVLDAVSAFLADPVSVAHHRHRTADTAQQGNGPRDASVDGRDRRPRQSGEDLSQRRPQGDGRGHHDDEHHGNADAHDFLEQPIPTRLDQHNGGRTVQNAVEDQVHGFTVKRHVDCDAGDADGAHQCRGDQETPYGQVAQEDPLHWLSEMFHATFQKRIAGGQLPSGKPLAEHELQESPQHDGPKNGHAELVAGERGSGQVTRPNARGRDQNPRADDRKQVLSAFRHAITIASRPDYVCSVACSCC